MDRLSYGFIYMLYLYMIHFYHRRTDEQSEEVSRYSCNLPVLRTRELEPL
jgi:hypothetical protein